MVRNVGLIILVIAVGIMFIEPARNFMNNLFKNKAELREEYVLGTVSGYNPRVREVQEILENAGFYSGFADGIMGRQTRIAIKEFQEEKALHPSGRVDSLTLLALNRQKEARPRAAMPGLIGSAGMPPSAATEKIVNPLQASLPVKAETKEAVIDIQTPSSSATEPHALKSLEKSKLTVKQIQAALKVAGFYKGKIDGKVGTQTKKAIKAFQKAHGLKTDGVVGQKTERALREYIKD